MAAGSDRRLSEARGVINISAVWLILKVVALRPRFTGDYLNSDGGCGCVGSPCVSSVYGDPMLIACRVRLIALRRRSHRPAIVWLVCPLNPIGVAAGGDPAAAWGAVKQIAVILP